MNKKHRLNELIDILNEASDYYYNKNIEKISNLEYDRLYDELINLEKETKIIKSNSPTQNIGYDVAKGLQKFEFEKPMLSLDKTKEVDKLAEFLSDKKGILSYKMDGLTVVLTYENGNLLNAVTRGNGMVGEIITQNAIHFKNLPISIPFKGKLVIRGEAVISYSDFEKINNSIENDNERYKNPRNLCSGTVRALDSSVVADRGVHFFCFSVVEGFDEIKFNSQKYEKLSSIGFTVVKNQIVDKNSIYKAKDDFTNNVSNYDYPVDGLVLLYDDIEYGLSLGNTAKFPKNAIAFKWQDETVETTLNDIFWSASRTGRINPIAIFDSVEIEGSTVKKASVHNLSMVRNLKLGIGDKITVYKANMIIPQIDENLTCSGNLEIPSKCPVCDTPLIIDDNDGVQVLYCPNKNCSAKRIKSFELFVSRDGFNIEGLSKATLELLIAHGFIHEFYDIFDLYKYKNQLCTLDRMGEKKVDNLLNSIEKSKNISLSAFIYSLGILQIGKGTAKILDAYYKNIDNIINTDLENLKNIEGIGEIIAKEIVKYFADEENIKVINRLKKIVNIQKKEEIINSNNYIIDKTFVITGKLNNFENRKELQDKIEFFGGKVTNSITKNTNYLINNDLMSNSTKNKKAKNLNIPIISEDEIIEMLK